MGSSLRFNKGKVLVNCFILGGFLLYSIFLAGPLFDRFETLPDEAKLVQVQLPGETDNIPNSLDRFVPSESALEIHGWAFIQGQSAEGSQIYLVFKSEETTYVFDTLARYTPHVTAQYKETNFNLDWSGFVTTIPMRTIREGKYTIGVYLVKNGIEALQYTKKAVEKSNGEVKLT